MLDGRMIWAPQFRRWPNQNLSDDLHNLLTLLQAKTLSPTPDVRQWKLKQSGLFTVNSLYKSLTGYRDKNNYFQWIWTTQAH